MKYNKFDTANYLDSPELIREYLIATLEENNEKLFLLALQNVVRSKGFTQIANKANLGRESLYKSLSGERDVKLSTAMKILNALGFHFSLQSISNTG